jgi:hypothetical protein
VSDEESEPIDGLVAVQIAPLDLRARSPSER